MEAPQAEVVHCCRSVIERSQKICSDVPDVRRAFFKGTGLIFPVRTMETTGAAFRCDALGAAVKMGILCFLHQDFKYQKWIWNHKCYLRCDKKIAPVLFHSGVVQCRGYHFEYFVICCDLLPRVRLQLTAVKQLVLWMLLKLDKISEMPVFSRLSGLASIIT